MSDDVRSKREPQLTEYRPTLKERIANTFMGDSRPSPERRQFAQGLADLAYYAPGVGEAIAGDALGRGIASGDYAAAAKAAAGVIPGTGKAVTSRLPKAFGGQSYASEMMAVGAKGGGRINTTIDRDPDWDMGLAEGGEVENALRIAERAKGGGAWTRKEGQNPEGGLNAKGRAAAKAEGHNLKPPAPNPKTEKDAARRKSFCARMSGMKKRLTSAETARDPDSRINKSLRAWNCHADGGEVWDKPRPKHIGKPKKLSDTERASAKAAAKKAGRPYPNLVDNMRAARADGGEVEDALRIAQRPMKPVRFHQTLARHGYEDGGSPQVEGDVQVAQPDDASQQAFLKEQLKGSAPQYEPEAGMMTAKEAGLMAAGMAPGAGIATAAGQFPTAEGGKEPSMREDWQAGNYGSAALKGLGAAGDVVSAVPVVGTAAGMAMKAPLAAKLAMAAAPMAKVAKGAAPAAKAVEEVAKPLGISEDVLSKYSPVMQESLKVHYGDYADDAAHNLFGKPASELNSKQHAKLEQHLADELLSDARSQGYGEHELFANVASPEEHLSPFASRSTDNAPPLSTDERLAVLHQFPSSHLDQIAEWGGLPTPSLAITKPENYLNQFGGYGDITLVGKKHLGTPAEDNPIFSTDAYTPTLPQISEGKFHSHVKGPDTPATLENLTEHMTKIPTRAGVAYTPGEYKDIANYDSPTSFYAHTAPLLKNIEDVNARRNLIDAKPGMYGFKAVDDLANIDDWLSAHADPKLKKELGSPSARAYVVDAARSGDLQKYFPTASKSDLALAQKILDERDTLYVPYFEGKPQRAVKLDEFAGALVPKGIDPEVIRKLEKLGLKTHAYEGNPGELVPKHFSEHLFSRGGDVEEAPEDVEETPKYERLTHPDGYYSRAHEVANGLPEGSLNWARMRRIMLEHPELLEEEMEASGLHSDAFDDEHKLTKADIARIIEEHFPRMKDEELPEE